MIMTTTLRVTPNAVRNLLSLVRDKRSLLAIARRDDWIVRGFLAALLLAAPAAAQKQAPPAPGAPKDFRVPPRYAFTLPNGMHVSMVPYGTVPKVFVRLIVRGGHQLESASEVNLSDLSADMMQEGGAGARTGEQLARDVASMGGVVTVNAGPDRSNIAGDVLSERGPDFVRVVADVARHPRFTESEFARVKATRLRNLSIARSQTQSLAQERFAALMFGDHPYGRVFPTEAMLSGFTLQQARDFWSKNFGAARAELFVTGVFDRGAMEAAIRSAFSDWAAGPPPVTVPAPVPVADRTVALIDRPDAVQSTVVVGLRTPGPADSAYVPLVVTDALLGGAFGSRITSNIREQKGYTYSPFSTVSTQQMGSYWAEQADVTTKVTGPSLTEIFGEIERLRKEAPPADELRGIQNNLAGIFTLQNSSRAGVASQLAFVDEYGLGDDFLTTYVRRVLSVTPEQVRRSAETYLVPGKMQLVVVGDKKIVAEQLSTWGKVVP
jgi:zinc protease